MATNRKKPTSPEASGNSPHPQTTIRQLLVNDSEFKPMSILDDATISARSKETPLHEQATQASQSILELDQKIAELETEIDKFYHKIRNMEEEAEIQGKMQVRDEYPDLDHFGEREPYEMRKKNIWLNAKQEYKELKDDMREAELQRSKLRAQRDHYHRMFKLQLSCLGSPNTEEFLESTRGSLGGLGTGL
jgi:predicted RNase H-like nuclease (RuvC/YqgF family)